MIISHVWLGYGSSMFLELGILSEGRKRKDGSVGDPQGEITVMVDFNWRVESHRSIVGGSNDSRRRCLSISQKLLRAKVTSAKVVGRLPELELQLSNGFWVVSFSHYKGQPGWAVLFNSLGLGALCVQRGKLYIETQ